MALFSTLRDDFSSPATSAGLWSMAQSGTAIYNQSGGILGFEVDITTGSDTGAASYTSASTYELSGSSVQVEVPSGSTESGVVTSMRVYLDSNPNYYAQISLSGGTIEYRMQLNSYYDASTATYNATNHRWWRIRFDGTTFRWDTSTDGMSWTNRKSFTGVSGGFTSKVKIGVATSGTAPKGGYSSFDNFNYGTASRTILSTATGGGTATLESESATISIVSSEPLSSGVAVFTTYQALPQKEYEYRVFDHDGNFIGVWQNVTSKFNYSQTINQNAKELNVRIARSPENRALSFTTLKDEDGNTIIDEYGHAIAVQTSTANSVGPDTDVDLNYNVDVYAFYGGYDQLLDEFSEPITDEENDPILIQFGAPNGKRVYSGYIADYSLSFGGTVGVEVVIVPHATEMNHYVFKDGTLTTVEYNSEDPVQMARDAVDNYNTQGGLITYTTATMPLSGEVVSFDFPLYTTREAVDKTIDLLPSGYYHFVDPGENLQYLLERGTEADHTFWYEKHITDLNLRKSITQLVNKVYFKGGVPEGSPDGTPDLFKYYEDAASVAAYRPGLERLSDSRVELAASAAIISESKIAELKEPRYRTSVVITDAVYDIETIKLGQMVGFANFGTFVDELLLQIVTITRSPHAVELELDMVVDGESKRLTDIKRRLLRQEYADVASSPS